MNLDREPHPHSGREPVHRIGFLFSIRQLDHERGESHDTDSSRIHRRGAAQRKPSCGCCKATLDARKRQQLRQRRPRTYDDPIRREQDEYDYDPPGYDPDAPSEDEDWEDEDEDFVDEEEEAEGQVETVMAPVEPPGQAHDRRRPAGEPQEDSRYRRALHP